MKAKVIAQNQNQRSLSCSMPMSEPTLSDIAFQLAQINNQILQIDVNQRSVRDTKASHLRPGNWGTRRVALPGLLPNS